MDDKTSNIVIVISVLAVVVLFYFLDFGIFNPISMMSNGYGMMYYSGWSTSYFFSTIISILIIIALIIVIISLYNFINKRRTK